MESSIIIIIYTNRNTIKITQVQLTLYEKIYTCNKFVNLLIVLIIFAEIIMKPLLTLCVWLEPGPKCAYNRDHGNKNIK